MIDAREAVSKEWTQHLLSVTFTPPRGMSDEGQNEVIRDMQEAVHKALPKRGRSELLDLTDRTRKRLRANAKTLAWPTVSEVLRAIREEVGEEKKRAEAEGQGWPHQNSEEVVETTIKWLDRFNAWPAYLEFPREVAAEVLTRTSYSKADLIRMGLRASFAEAREAGVEWGNYADAPKLQRMPGGFD